MPEEVTYTLSEMYANSSDAPELELKVKVLNINLGMNESLMHSCKMLSDYSIFVAKVREYSQTQSLNKAVPLAIDYCISHDVLKDFLIRERKAVTMYSLYEYNKSGHMKVIKEEAFEEGSSKERTRIVTSLLDKGKSPEDISSSCDIPLDIVLAIKKSMK